MNDRTDQTTRGYSLEVDGMTLAEAVRLRTEVIPLIKRIGVHGACISLFEPASTIAVDMDQTDG